jgi:hypothetical protein
VTMKSDSTRGWWLLKTIVFWMLFITFVCLVMAPLFSIGGQESVVEISKLGRISIGVLAALAGLSLLAWYLVNLRSEAIDGEFASTRRTRPARRFFQASAITLTVSAVTGMFSWLWVCFLVRHLPATHEEMQGLVTQLIRTGGENIFCRLWIDVQLNSGSQVRICGELGLFSRTVPPEMRNLQKGALVTVRFRTTMLGTSATIIRRSRIQTGNGDDQDGGRISYSPMFIGGQIHG